MTSAEFLIFFLVPFVLVVMLLSARNLWLKTRQLRRRPYIRKSHIAFWIRALCSFLTSVAMLFVFTKFLISDGDFANKLSAAIHAIPIAYVFSAIIKILYTAFVLVTFMLFSAFAIDFRKQQERKKRLGEPHLHAVRHGIGVLAAMAGLSLFYYLAWRIVEALTRQNRVVLGVLVIILLSLFLFLLKLKALIAYAVAEITFAFLVCATTLSLMKDVIEPVQILSLFTSIYLFIRGFDNLNKGIKERSQKNPKPSKQKILTLNSPETHAK